MKKKKILSIGLVSTFLVAAITASMHSYWEPTGETWGYWVFARIFKETGRFIIIDRSPLYILYLQLFSFLPYPLSLQAEYVVSITILLITYIQFSRRYFPLTQSILLSLFWIPYFQISEPPTQRLALACSLIALTIRQNMYPKRYSWFLFYALLVCCYVLRTTYMFFSLPFLITDFKYMLFHSVWKKKNFFIPHLRFDWPMYIMLSFYLLVTCLQSPHPWNTIFFATSRWFPHDGKRFEIFQAYNIQYIKERYGSFEKKDFYETNKELFPHAKTTWQAFRVHPTFFFHVWVKFFLEAIPIMGKMTIFAWIIFSIQALNKNVVFTWLFLCCVSLFVFITAYKKAKDTHIKNFLSGNLLMIGVMILYTPQIRYFFPMIPFLTLSTSWAWDKLSSFTKKSYIVSLCSLVLIVGILSNGVPLWYDIFRFRSSSRNPRSWYLPMISIADKCSGIISLEATYIAAFAKKVPLENIHDIWELPPFGSYETQSSSLLRPVTINCLFISYDLQTKTGSATNTRIRYMQYILPYARFLLRNGGSLYQIPSYGDIIVAPKQNLHQTF